ncbi:MAG TPA: MBL fold metallo-hydrolase [Spirochaetales bacterium]|nr:MBL fold metallo-hydrolase [Spirochaetales bacterium]
MTDASEISRKPDSGKALLSRSDDRLSIFFIGAGSAFTKRYYQNNALVVKGDDHLLIDCGTRAPEALTRLGLSVTDIDTYLITHSHADHIGGLEEVMLLNRYMAGKKPTMIAPAAYRAYLWKRSLKGGAAHNERRDGRYLRFEDLWDAVDLEPVPGADRQLCETSVGSIRLAMFRTMHIPDSAPSWRSCAPSYGVVIDGRVLYTSDTRYDPEMLRFVEERYDIESVFHDCQLFTGGVHASLDELAGLPPALKAKTLLMHYGDAVDSAEAKAETLGFKGFARQWTPYLFG